MRSKRPWKKVAEITRYEHNNGDVKFITSPRRGVGAAPLRQFEALTDAEQFLDKWYAEWWPVQTKSTRRA